MPTPLESARVTWALIRASLRGAAQYRLNFVLLSLMGIAYQGSGFAFIAVVLHRYGSIAGWSFPDIAFLYGLRLVAHVLYLLPLNMLFGLDGLVRNGTFDRFLVRPLSPFLQVLTHQIRVNCLGDVITATGVLVYASRIADLHWSAGKVLYCAAAVIGGAMIEGGLMTAISAMSFRFVEVWPLRYLADNLLLSFGSYPMSVFGVLLQWMLTWILPVAFIAWIPAGVVLDHVGGLGVSATVAWVAPLMGVAWALLGGLVWRRQVNAYVSAGS
jgi:viologen exporter family transport system permease protein